MARTNDMLNREEFLHRINRLRMEIKTGMNVRGDKISTGEVSRLRGVLSSWIGQYKKRYGVNPSMQSESKVMSQLEMDR
ncbi:hypothetical protein CMI37_09325 [Candidatus Pacearchaeota archaeon]|nr:hypothetical protein [Candidatus Pacearchaeota archaeon]